MRRAIPVIIIVMCYITLLIALDTFFPLSNNLFAIYHETVKSESTVTVDYHITKDFLVNQTKKSIENDFRHLNSFRHRFVTAILGKGYFTYQSSLRYHRALKEDALKALTGTFLELQDQIIAGDVSIEIHVDREEWSKRYILGIGHRGVNYNYIMRFYDKEYLITSLDITHIADILGIVDNDNFEVTDIIRYDAKSQLASNVITLIIFVLLAILAARLIKQLKKLYTLGELILLIVVVIDIAFSIGTFLSGYFLASAFGILSSFYLYRGITMMKYYKVALSLLDVYFLVITIRMFEATYVLVIFAIYSFIIAYVLLNRQEVNNFLSSQHKKVPVSRNVSATLRRRR